MHDRLEPQLATLVRTPPEGQGWVHEPKLDGYRILAHRPRTGDVRLFTRGQQDWTHRMPDIASALGRALPADSWLDGEVVVFDESGVSSFQRLQGALGEESRAGLVYFVFDLLVEAGTDLRSSPLSKRTARLRKLARKDVYKRQASRSRRANGFHTRLHVGRASSAKVAWPSRVAVSTAAARSSCRPPVSYTHLDVYKRQARSSTP